MPNVGFPGMGVPTIIISRKNLKRNHGSPKINPINLFAEMDSIFESFFDSIADTLIQENEEMRKKNKNSKEDDHIDLDEIDLSLNETDLNHEVHSEHEKHIKLNYVKDFENKQEKKTEDNELKVEDVDKHEEQSKIEKQIEK